MSGEDKASGIIWELICRNISTLSLKWITPLCSRVVTLRSPAFAHLIDFSENSALLFLVSLWPCYLTTDMIHRIEILKWPNIWQNVIWHLLESELRNTYAACQMSHVKLEAMLFTRNVHLNIQIWDIHHTTQHTTPSQDDLPADARSEARYVVECR